MANNDYDNRQEFTDFSSEYIDDNGRTYDNEAADILPNPDSEKSSGWKTAAIAASGAVIIGGIGTAVYAMSTANEPQKDGDGSETTPGDGSDPAPVDATTTAAASSSTIDATTAKTTTTNVTHVHNYTHNDYYVHHHDLLHPVWIDAEVPVAFSPSDHMSFSQAFASARAEVGPGGCFAWRGGIYGTYYYDEWHNMSSADKAIFAGHFDWNYIDHSYTDLRAWCHIDPLEIIDVDTALEDQLVALRDAELAGEAVAGAEGEGEVAAGEDPIVGVVDPNLSDPVNDPTLGEPIDPAVVGVDLANPGEDPVVGVVDPNSNYPYENPVAGVEDPNFVDPELGPDYNNGVEVLGYESEGGEDYGVEFEDPSNVVVEIDGDISYAGMDNSYDNGYDDNSYDNGYADTPCDNSYADNYSEPANDYSDPGMDYSDSSMDMASDYNMDQSSIADSYGSMDIPSDVC